MNNSGQNFLPIVCGVLLALCTVLPRQAQAQGLDEQLHQLAEKHPDRDRIVEIDELTSLFQKGIEQRDTQFLVRVLGTKERLIGHEALRVMMTLPERYRYSFCALIVEEESFWTNPIFENGAGAEIRGVQQSVVATLVSYMIQKNVSPLDFYEPKRRRQIGEIVSDVAKNGLPNRDPNWKPEVWIGDVSPKKTIILGNPKNLIPLEDRIASPMPTENRPTQARQNASPSPSAEPQSSTRFPLVPVAIVAVPIIGGVIYLLRRKRQKMP